MSESSMPWIKLHTDALDDHKLGQLPHDAQLLFFKLCLLAGVCDQSGYLADGEDAMDAEDIAWRLREDLDWVKENLAYLTSTGLVVLDDSVCLVKNFAKRQGRPQSAKREQWKVRKQKSRAKPVRDIQEPPETVTEDKEEIHADVTEDTSVTHGGVTLTEERREEEILLEEEGEEAALNEPDQPVLDDPGWIFKLYTDEIGLLTPLISETIQETEKDFPRAWVEAAVKEAVTNQARNWKYVEAILKRWKKDGFGAPYPRGPSSRNGGKSPTEPAGFDGIRKFMEKDNGE